ncbi:MAG: hypothetical protein KDK97_09210, partial [Verrucomicrobiales bacterium]|nr:hypothetical protein [Verrucomicrobiales bacterium]
MSVPTLLDIAKLDAGIGYPLIEEAVKLAPELMVVPADTILGTTMELTVRTGLPSVRFRNANEGVPRSKSSYETRTFQTHILDHQVAVDEQIVNGARDKGRLLENHASGVMEATMQYIGSQFYYGTGNDAKGFPGLLAQCKSDAAHTVDASGAASKTSVWFLRLGRECVEFLFGNGQTIRLNETWELETVYDDNGNPYKAYTNWMKGRVGMRLANKNCAVRIKNVEETGTNKKTLNDTLLYAAYEKFTEFGFEPTHIFMNGRSREQLRNSRTATNSNGTPAPLPTEWEGIPIIRTASIAN